MKAILINDDRSLRWDNVPDPILGEDDCLIKIEAAAVNRADLMQREGDYPPPPGCHPGCPPDFSTSRSPTCTAASLPGRFWSSRRRPARGGR